MLTNPSSVLDIIDFVSVSFEYIQIIIDYKFSIFIDKEITLNISDILIFFRKFYKAWKN